MTTTDALPATWPLPTTFAPRPYQLVGLRRATDNHLVLEHGLGAGKSTVSLAVLEVLGIQHALVLCPPSVKAVWRDELAENAARSWVVWAGEVKGNNGKALKNPSVARRVEAITQAREDARRLRRPFMAVVNYESTHQAVMSKFLLGSPWDALICDESQHLAGSASSGSRFTAKLAKLIRARGGRIILCTGTFMPHSALSVFGQMRTLNPDVLGWSWPAFKARYAKWRVLRETAWCPGCMKAANVAYIGELCTRERPYNGCAHPPRDTMPCGEMIVRGDPVYHKTPRGDLIPDGVREDRRDELMARLRPWVHRVSQEELDAQTGLVEAVPQLRTCTLDPAARKAYDALKRDLIAQVADGTIVAANAMVAVGKLMMLTSGHYRDASTGEMQVFGGALCAKAQLLMDEFGEVDPTLEPTVVFYQYRYDASRIRAVCSELGLRYGELSGQRTDGLDGKYMAPNIDVLACQWQSGSEGINLSRSHTQIDYSLTFKLTQFQQAGRRLNRQGQVHACTRRVLACEETIDIGCFHALKKRQITNDSILRLLGD